MFASSQSTDRLFRRRNGSGFRRALLFALWLPASLPANEGSSHAATKDVAAPPPVDRPASAAAATNTQAVTLPACLRLPPKYPPAALRAGEEGRVSLGFEVLDGGIAQDAVVQVSSGARRLDEAALAHFRYCLEVIGEQSDSGLKPGRYSLPVLFKLD